MDARELGRMTTTGAQPEGSFCGRRAAGEVKKALRRMEAVRERLSRRSWERLPGGVEWLLDNAYLARRAGLSAQEDLRRGRRLRQTGGTAYIQTLARAAAERLPEWSREALSEYLAGVQETCPMTEEELSLFLPALRGGVVPTAGGAVRSGGGRA